MLVPRFRTVPALLLLTLVACDKNKPNDATAAADGKQNADNAQGMVEKAVASVDAPKEVRTFIKDQRKKGCEMLPPTMAASVLEVPEAELKQMKIMGCIYKWKNNDQIAEGSIMSIWVRKSADEARLWFNNSTKGQTKEELQATIAQATEKAKERKEIDTKLKKDTTDKLGGVAAAMMPEGGYQYEDVAGIGDAARMNMHDGTITVLMGNMIFNVQAYKGAGMPPLDPAVIRSANVKKITAASKEVQHKWLRETIDVRKALGTKLAKAIAAAV